MQEEGGFGSTVLRLREGAPKILLPVEPHLALRE